MGRAGYLVAGSSFCEDRPLECTMEPDEGTSEPADDTLTITLCVRLEV